jgi:hypothetical protein
MQPAPRNGVIRLDDSASLCIQNIQKWTADGTLIWRQVFGAVHPRAQLSELPVPDPAFLFFAMSFSVSRIVGGSQCMDATPDSAGLVAIHSGGVFPRCRRSKIGCSASPERSREMIKGSPGLDFSTNGIGVGRPALSRGGVPQRLHVLPHLASPTSYGPLTMCITRSSSFARTVESLALRQVVDRFSPMRLPRVHSVIGSSIWTIV